jgi:hypothetical protein
MRMNEGIFGGNHVLPPRNEAALEAFRFYSPEALECFPKVHQKAIVHARSHIQTAVAICSMLV